ncbi:H-NS family nucleoid-associated regulatory protein [Paraburkholderia humisilvae]|uniref:H-NS histone family protein n=1 Tax=Paraburkholderia humisilvae TaxID=627669 RepID=UPI0015825A55
MKQASATRHLGRKLVDRRARVEFEFVPFLSHATPKGIARYRDPANPLNTWSGRGQRPAWLNAYVEQGRAINEFMIPGAPPRIMSARYYDPTNPSNTWTGYGRRPTWLAAYLEAGRRLEEFEVPGKI